MSLLQEFIDQHYIGFERDELIVLLGRYELMPILEQTLSFRQQLFQISESTPPRQLIPLASTFASTALTAIKSKIAGAEQPDEKEKLRTAIAQMGLRFYLSFIRMFPDDMIEVTKEMTHALPEFCKDISVDYDEIKKHFNVEQLVVVIKEISGESFVHTIKPLPIPKQPQLQWREKGQLAFLAYELKRRNWIRRKSEWMDFLDPQRKKGIVQWNENFKYELAHLLYSLYSGDFIKPTGHKGYFTIAEAYLRDYSGKKFTKRALKKLSCNINADLEKYQDITNKVKVVIDKIISR